MNNIKEKIARALYTGLGLGLMPKAPGTFGTLLGIPIYYIIVYCVPKHVWVIYFLVMLLIFALGLWSAKKAEVFYKKHDAPQIVIDEVLGYMVTMSFIPKDYLYAPILGFVFFRFFDILKPWPVSWADKKCAGALGVMLDDVLAGIYAWIILNLVYYF